jgi:hypothetical protein
MTLYSNVEHVKAGRNISTYTPLGFIHLKDDLALGIINHAVKYYENFRAGFSHEHGIRVIPYKNGEPAVGRKPAKDPRPAKIDQSFRRYFIQMKHIDAVDEVPASEYVAATATEPEKPAVEYVPGSPARTEFRIGFQNQIGDVSKMASGFGRIVVQVLQDFFDANFSVAGFPAAAVPGFQVASSICKDPRNAMYTAAKDIGKREDNKDIDVVAIKAATAGTPAAKEAAVLAARQAHMLPLPIIGGKRKTRRSNKKRRTTRKR